MENINNANPTDARNAPFTTVQTEQTPQPPKRNKVRIMLFVLVAFILGIFIGFILRPVILPQIVFFTEGIVGKFTEQTTDNQQGTKSDQSLNRDNIETSLDNSDTRNAQTKQTLTDEWNIPDLPVGFVWQTKNLSKEGLMRYRMFWTSTNDDNSYGEIPFSINLYTIDLNYDNQKEISYYDNYLGDIGKFSEEVVSKGWSDSVNYKNKRISGVAADGVFGTTYGFVKIINDQIRSVGYSYNLDYTSWEGPGSDITCPCHLHKEIFVGDIVNLEDILK